MCYHKSDDVMLSEKHYIYSSEIIEGVPRNEIPRAVHFVLDGDGSPQGTVDFINKPRKSSHSKGLEKSVQFLKSSISVFEDSTKGFKKAIKSRQKEPKRAKSAEKKFKKAQTAILTFIISLN